MACIDDIVSVGLCNDEISTSGLKLMNAEGMSPLNAEHIATEQYGNGITMLAAKKANAITMVKNDFLSVLQVNNIASTVASRTYETSIFNVADDMGTYAGLRGVRLNGVQTGKRGGLKKLKVRGIQCYPLVSGDAEIVIVDYISGVQTTWTYPVTLVANSVNEFIFRTDGYETPYVAQSRQIAVLFDNTDINFCSAKIKCLKGCNGTVSNECAWAEGWDGTAVARKEGYGINVLFECSCDYDSLLCDLSKPYIGELIWLKWQELVFREQYLSNRFEGWVIYNREDLWNNVIPDIVNRYNTKFNSMVSGGLFNMLKQYQDDCLNCRGIRSVVNI